MSTTVDKVDQKAVPAAVVVDNVSKIYPGGVEALNDMTVQFPT